MKTFLSKRNLFDHVTIIYYHTLWRVAALIRRLSHPMTVWLNAELTRTGATNSIVDIFDRLFSGIIANLKAVENMDHDQWPPLAYIRNMVGELEPLIYPFETEKERLHARGQILFYPFGLSINLLSETFLFSLLASFLLPGAKPMSPPGLLLGFVLAFFGTLAVHVGLKLIFNSLHAYEYYQQKRMTKMAFVERILWATIGLIVFALNFFLVWFAAETREAYLKLSAAKGEGQLRIYEALNYVIISLSLAMPILLACAKHFSKDAHLLLAHRKAVKRFNALRAARLAKVEQALAEFYSRLYVIEIAYHQLLDHQFLIQRKNVDCDNAEQATELSEALTTNPVIDDAFFMKYHMVWYTRVDMIDFALKRDSRYKEIMKKITEAQKLLDYLYRHEYRKPFEVTNETNNQLMTRQTHKPTHAINGHPVLNGIVSIFFALLTITMMSSCKQESHNVVVAIDLSASIGSASESYQDAAFGLIDNIKPGYTLTFIAVHGGSQTAGQELMQFSYSQETDDSLTLYTDGLAEQVSNYRKRKAALLNVQKNKLRNRLGLVNGGDHLQQTDLFGALAVGKGYLNAEAKTNQIVFLSDGLHDSGIRMLRNVAEKRKTAGSVEVVMTGKVDIPTMLLKAPEVSFADIPDTKLVFFVGHQSNSYTPEVMGNTKLLWKKYSDKQSLVFWGFLSTPTPLIKAVYEAQ